MTLTGENEPTTKCSSLVYTKEGFTTLKLERCETAGRPKSGASRTENDIKADQGLTTLPYMPPLALSPTITHNIRRHGTTIHWQSRRCAGDDHHLHRSRLRLPSTFGQTMADSSTLYTCDFNDEDSHSSVKRAQLTPAQDQQILVQFTGVLPRKMYYRCGWAALNNVCGVLVPEDRSLCTPREAHVIGIVQVSIFAAMVHGHFMFVIYMPESY
ncbi:hypothetical protein EDD15DRAFT_2308601 [Pisolithus albus]|nr:hypothetical protein EDD15DRAFT_2308601 [Pisolithus albus]